MLESMWHERNDPKQLVLFLSNRARRSRARQPERKFRLFACACCRLIWDGLEDQRSRTAVEVCEQFADGMANRKELTRARRGAYTVRKRLIRATPITERDKRQQFAVRAAHLSEAACGTYGGEAAGAAGYHASIALTTSRNLTGAAAAKLVCDVLRDIFGNPVHPVSAEPSWQTATVVSLAQAIYDQRRFQDMPILADALEEAGCTNEEVLAHCRSEGPHTRGCWLVDLLLGKE